MFVYWTGGAFFSNTGGVVQIQDVESETDNVSRFHVFAIGGALIAALFLISILVLSIKLTKAQIR